MATTISFTPTRCIMGAGKFDTNFRYIRVTASSGFPLPKDRTVRIAQDTGNTRYTMWRWSDSVSSAEWKISGSTGLGDATATLVTL